MTKTNEDRRWFEITMVDDAHAEINLYDEIGLWGITAKEFSDELKTIGKPKFIDLYINSPGGEVFVGFSIYNLLERFKARNKTEITVHVDGLAASIASVIAMVGDEVHMASNSMMMIHNPAGFVIGDSREMRQIANALDKMKESAISIYAKKTDKDRDEIWEMMDDETWMSAQEAQEMGFADKVTDAIEAVNSFDLSRFINPPTMMAGGTKRHPPRKTKETTMDKPVETAPNPAPSQQAPAPAPAPVPAVAPAPVETEAQMRDRIKAEMAAKRKQISTMCTLAGRPDLVEGFVNEDKTLDEVMAALEAAKAQPVNQQRSTPSNSNEVSNRHAANPSNPAPGAPVQEIDTSAIYNKWNGVQVRR